MPLQRKLQLLIATVFFFTLLLGSFVIFYIPSAQLESTDQLTLFFGVSIFIILALVGTAVVLYILRVVIGPLEELADNLSEEYSPELKLDVSDSVKTLNNEIGSIARAVENITNISTEQYHTLEEKVQRRTKAMEESKAKDEAIIKNIAEGLVVTDTERKIMFANPSAEKMLGYKLYELFERVWPDFLLVKDKQKEEIPLDKLAITRALTTNKPVNAQIGEHSYLMRKNGSIFPALVSAAPINIGDQQLGAVIVFRDVEKEIEVDKTKTEFVSLASHQLRTPLSTINWYVETILSGDVGDLQADQRPYFEQIYESTQRMIDLVNALLNVSRLEMGTFMVEPEAVKLDELVEKVLDELEPKLLAKEIELSKKFDSDIPEMQLDQQLMWIILQNLLTNSIKYTPSHGKVTVGLKRYSAGTVLGKIDIAQDSMVIYVSDTGYGIPSHQQDQVFSKLFRADNVREKETEGTGLGLYIIKSIIDHIDGQVWFESTEGVGTTFYVSLPLGGMKKREGTKALSAGSYN